MRLPVKKRLNVLFIAQNKDSNEVYLKKCIVFSFLEVDIISNDSLDPVNKSKGI